MPEPVGEIEGRHWWPALILLILDLDISVEMAIRTTVAALNPATGRISCLHVLYHLQAVEKTLKPRQHASVTFLLNGLSVVRAATRQKVTLQVTLNEKRGSRRTGNP